MEARALPPDEESPSLAKEKEARETAPEGSSVEDERLKVSRAGESAASQDREQSEIDTRKNPSEAAPQEVIVIQAGTFRSLANAESLKHRLSEKGYDVYLDTKTLPRLGLVHLVRIRGYNNMEEAKADNERLQREEKIDSLIITPGKASTGAADEE